MKTFAALTLSATVLFTAAPVQANPVTEALHQLAASQLAEIRVNVAEQARQAVEKTASDVRQLLQSEPPVAQAKEVVAKVDTKPAVE